MAVYREGPEEDGRKQSGACGRQEKANCRKLCHDNKGVSFVEVIISMLVLAIALIPLLGAFMTSFRINLKSRRAMSASIVAQNVMECVKEYAGFHAVVSGVSMEMKAFLPAGYAASFSQTADGFVLDSVTEGSSEYRVEVSYNKTDFTNENNNGINDYKIPDLTTLDSDDTIVICPAGVAGGQLEDAAVYYFSELWVMKQWAAHSEEEDYAGPGAAAEEAQRVLIRQLMTGNLTLSLEQNVTGAYYLLADLTYEYDGVSYPAYHITSDSAAELNNIYVFYDPARLEPLGADRYEIQDTLTLMNFNKELNFFLAVQESEERLGVTASELTGPYIDGGGTSMGKVTIYSSTGLEFGKHYSLPFEDAKSLIARKKYERMQNVTVRVYLKESNDLMSAMTTAISQ